MINRSAKGRNHELEDIKFYTAQGFEVAFRSIRTRFQRIDLGPFDSLLYHYPVVDMPSRQMVYVSSKSNGNYTQRHVTEIDIWAKTIVSKESIVELRDHHDSYWKFKEARCKHASGCKLAKKVWKAAPRGDRCPKCKRKIKIVRDLIPAQVRVIRFATE